MMDRVVELETLPSRLRDEDHSRSCRRAATMQIVEFNGAIDGLFHLQQ
jgi:hypothetical protein